MCRALRCAPQTFDDSKDKEDFLSSPTTKRYTLRERRECKRNETSEPRHRPLERFPSTHCKYWNKVWIQTRRDYPRKRPSSFHLLCQLHCLRNFLFLELVRPWGPSLRLAVRIKKKRERLVSYWHLDPEDSAEISISTYNDMSSNLSSHWFRSKVLFDSGKGLDVGLHPGDHQIIFVLELSIQSGLGPPVTAVPHKPAVQDTEKYRQYSSNDKAKPGNHSRGTCSEIFWGGDIS